MIVSPMPRVGEEIAAPKAGPVYHLTLNAAAGRPTLLQGAVGPLGVTINEIESMFGHDDHVGTSEDRPTEHARRMARRFLEEAQAGFPDAVPASQVEAFEGDLILHWDVPGKGLALVIPSGPERAPRIYEEVIEGRVAQKRSSSEASPDRLVDAIRWISSRS